MSEVNGPSRIRWSIWLVVAGLSAVLGVVSAITSYRLIDSGPSWLEASANVALIVLTVAVLFIASFGVRRRRLTNRLRLGLPRVLACLVPQLVGVLIGDVAATRSAPVLGLVGILGGALVAWAVLCAFAHVAQRLGESRQTV